MTLDLEVERKRESVLGEERRLKRACLVHMQKHILKECQNGKGPSCRLNVV